MWEQTPLTSSVQVEALRLLEDWWECTRSRERWGRPGAIGTTRPDALVRPRPARTG